MPDIFGYKINPTPTADDQVVVATVTNNIEIPTRIKLEDMKVRSTAGTSYTLTQVMDYAALAGVGVTAGTVAASKAVVVDSNKDISAFRNVTVTNLDAGASGTAGTVDIFPATASKGKTQITSADNTTNTTTTIAVAAQAGAITYTVPDVTTAASFVMTEGAQTVNGAKTFGSTLTAATTVVTNIDAGASGTAGSVDIFPTTASKGKIALVAADSTGNTTTTITNASQAGAVTYTIPDAGASASFVMSEAAQTVNGAKTWGSNVGLGAGTTLKLDSQTASLTTNAVTLTKYAAVVTSESLTTAAGAAQAFVLTLTGVAAGDLAFVQGAGGTNTREHIAYKAITSTNTVTVTVNNIGPTNAINGTLIFNLWVCKA